MTSRLAGRFESLRARGGKALIPYIVVGDPFAGFTVDLMHRLVRAGADIIELGVPFSDPMAEGPVIQRAHERALEKGVSLADILVVVAQFRQADTDTPVLLMGYANPVATMGYRDFADRAAESGLDALLTVDMPPEETAALNGELKRVEMDNIFLVAPTTPTERIEKIAAVATGFVYYVSFKGVTGASRLDVPEVAERLAVIRRYTQLPLAVGFGIKDPESAAAVAAVADGVVVGSALVRLMETAAEEGCSEGEVLDRAGDFVTALRGGMDKQAET